MWLLYLLTYYRKGVSEANQLNTGRCEWILTMWVVMFTKSQTTRSKWSNVSVMSLWPPVFCCQGSVGPKKEKYWKQARQITSCFSCLRNCTANAILLRFRTKKLEPHLSVKWKLKGSAESQGVILSGAWTSAENVFVTHPLVGPQGCTNWRTSLESNSSTVTNYCSWSTAFLQAPLSAIWSPPAAGGMLFPSLFPTLTSPLLYPFISHLLASHIPIHSCRPLSSCLPDPSPFISAPWYLCGRDIWTLWS